MSSKHWKCRIGWHKWKKVAESFMPIAKFNDYYECERCGKMRVDQTNVIDFY